MDLKSIVNDPHHKGGGFLASNDYELLDSLKPALDFHYKYCSHHPEYYKDGFRDMSFIDRVEMILDWKAATKRSKNGDVCGSIEKNQNRFQYSDVDKEWFKKIVKDIS